MDAKLTPLQHKLYAHLGQQFDLPIEKLHDAGTSILPTDSISVTGSQWILQMEQRHFVRCHPDKQSVFEQVLVSKLHDYRLQASDLDNCAIDRVLFYTVDKARFRPFTPAPKYDVRQLTPDDATAFDAFQAQCSVADREEGDVGLDHDIIYGVLDGERIVSVASSFELWGMVDFGIITDPNYRKQGLGKAVVSAITQHYLDSDDVRLLLYRHDAANFGSRGVVQGLNYLHFATVDYVTFNTDKKL